MVVIGREIHRVTKLSSLINNLVIQACVLIKSVSIIMIVYWQLILVTVCLYRFYQALDTLSFSTIFYKLLLNNMPVFGL